jgi:hypothetical protein
MVADMRKYLFAILLVVSSQLQAEALPDPTRPPPGIGADGTALASGLIPAYPKVRGLQSVMLSPAHCAAIIDGKTIEMGAMYGKERLVDVTESGVVLQGENGRRTLTLFPAVGIKQNESISQDARVNKCHIEQKRQAKNPAKPAGLKEKK